ncbi:MAG TPA: hypothetical protein VKA27_05400 [Sunxiuqinia sp.]|nr:hypothetical protein [Sunxiuqinia sp.]
MKTIHLRNNLTKLAILLCLSFLISSVFAESINDKKHPNEPTQLTFTTSKGTVSITLPSQIIEGDQVSGTINIISAGKNDHQLTKNKSQLNGYSVQLLTKRWPVRNGKMTFKVPPTNRLFLSLNDERGKEIGNKSIPIVQTVPRQQMLQTGYHIQTYIVTGSPAQIKGVFDGSLTTSSVALNGENLPILAESNHELMFDVPVEFNGPNTIKLQENETTTMLKTNLLNLELSVDKMSLMKGESTKLHIKVSGLERLRTPVPLRISNQSPANISIEGGNEQERTIDPATASNEGIYRETADIRAYIRGNFSITVAIDPPGETETLSETPPILCDCRIYGRSYLLSPDFCKKLGGQPFDPNAENETLPITETEQISKANIRLLELPVQQTDSSFQVHLQLHTNETLAGIRYSYKNVLDSGWQSIPAPETATKLTWPSSEIPNGFYVIRAKAVNQSNATSESYFYSDIQIGSTSLDNTLPSGIVATISQDAIDRARHRARQTHDHINDKADELDRLRRAQREAIAEQNHKNELANQLEKIDEVLDGVPRAYRSNINDLLDSMRNLKGQLPSTTDTTLLKQAVADARARLKACQARLKNLKKEQADLEKKRDDLKKLQDEALNEMDQLYHDNGWIGGHGYHSDGRYWFGYVGDENSNLDISEQAHAIQKRLHALRPQYVNTLKRLKELPDAIAAAQKDCDRLNEELQKAKNAAQKGDEYAATQVAMDDLCRQIRTLLHPLLQWCHNHPNDCRFEDEIIGMMKDCPTDSTSWAHFWGNFNHLLETKKQLEDQLRDQADDQQAEADHLGNKIDNTDDEIKRLREQEQAENEQAENLRRRRAQQLADAQNAREEQERRERERNKVKPAPTLDEPVDPSNDQLKFQAQIVFRRLFQDLYTTEGCSCKTKAVILANNTNTIVTDLIGRIGVAVIFAPLEAFPGVGLGGHLAMGALKALASSIFGGQELPDELVKNLFNVIGGEIFPKLVGNKFSGDRINSLAGKGLDKILEAEGARLVHWEGSCDSRCGKLSGTTTMLINPNTGWVIIMIHVNDCPLVVIKYRINKDGVAISNPIINTI